MMADAKGEMMIVNGCMTLLGALALLGAMALFAGAMLTRTLAPADGFLMLSLLVFVVIVQLYDIGTMLAKRNKTETEDEKQK